MTLALRRPVLGERAIRGDDLGRIYCVAVLVDERWLRALREQQLHISGMATNRREVIRAMAINTPVRAAGP